MQLRQDNVAGTLYNLVGFQTNMKWGAQEEVLRLIPGLQHAEFVRLGQMHRNTFINSPTLLQPTLQFKDARRSLLRRPDHGHRRLCGQHDGRPGRRHQPGALATG